MDETLSATIILRLILGEDFLPILLGVPYLALILSLESYILNFCLLFSKLLCLLPLSGFF